MPRRRPDRATADDIKRLLARSEPLPFGLIAARLGSGRGLKSALSDLRDDGRVAYESGRYAWKDPEASQSHAEPPSRAHRRVAGRPMLGAKPRAIICVLRRPRRVLEAVPLIPSKDLRSIRVFEACGCSVGDVVEMSVATDTGFPRGRIVDAWCGELGADAVSDIACKAAGICDRWPGGLTRAARDASALSSAPDGREDLRNVPFVTIDGDDARDFDDAVAARERSGGWELLVAVADVSHYVPSGSDLDTLARERGNSTYFPTRAVPMLPEALSNGICSLRPREDRLAVVCTLQVDARGRIQSFRFELARIRSRARLTYREAGRLLRLGAGAGIDSALRSSLTCLHEATCALALARKARGAISLELPEYKPKLEDDRPVDIHAEPRSEAHALIEEAMIAANVAAAELLEGSPSAPLYRVHPGPSESDYRELRSIFLARNCSLPSHSDMRSAFFQAAQASENFGPANHVFQSLLIKAMQKAEYSPTNAGHFGLALERYLHFTSPIRRYPDLYNHRLLKAKLSGKQMSAKLIQQAASLGWHTSDTERRSATAERVATRWLASQTLVARCGEVLVGTVSGVQPFGVFVQIDDCGLQGLVHRSCLHPDQYIANGSTLRAANSGRELTIGDRVRVKLANVEPPTASLDLRLVSHPLTRTAWRSHSN